MDDWKIDPAHDLGLTGMQRMRSLKREGIVVDAYLDLRDNDVKGTGMTLKTDYLIVGESPGWLVFAFTSQRPSLRRNSTVSPFIDRLILVTLLGSIFERSGST